MHLSFVTLCLSLLLKLISGAGLNICTVDDLYWGLSEECTLEEFSKIVEAAIRHDNIDFLKSIPSMASAEKRVWYFAKYCDTQWAMDPDLISNEDLEQNVPAITIANNAAVLTFLSPKLRSRVMCLVNLATHDAENLASTLPYSSDLHALARKDLDQRGAIRIVELLEKREIRVPIHPMNVFAHNATVIKRFLACKSWKPSLDDIPMLLAHDLQAGIIVLLEWMKEVPSIKDIKSLIWHGSLGALQCIRSFSPDWMPSQDQFDTAIVKGHLEILRWFDSINVATTSSPFALTSAAKSGHSATIAWYLSEYNFKHAEQIIFLLNLKESLDKTDSLNKKMEE
jgi:hypothetical protein